MASPSDVGRTAAWTVIEQMEVSMQFETMVRLEGKTATGLEVPEAMVEALGAGKRAKVVVTINGYSYRSSVAPYNGVYMLPLSAEHRTAAGVAAGDMVTVGIALDNEVRVVTVPDDLAAALAVDPARRAAFDALSYSNQRRHVLSVEDAKTPETRARRVAKVVEGV
jgi:hypothetical protein